MIPRLALYGLLGAALVGGVLLGARWLVKTGERLQEAEYKAAQAEYDRAQLVRVEKANHEYAAKNQSLQERADAARSSPPVRYIRVPVGASCEAPKPADAAVPEVDPGAGSVLVADRGYDSFREFLIGYAAGPQHGGGTDSTVRDSR